MFRADPSQIEGLDSLGLVGLLRRLLYAEAQQAGIKLNDVSVPLQITVPDGGEDGRVQWTGGNESTDYLPSRTTLFQSKASSIGPNGWKKECWTKSSQRKGRARKLSSAMDFALSNAASYVGFTTEPLVGTKITECVESIRAGIKDAGGDPEKLSAIKVYGSNEIANWVDQHPSIALWLAELSQKQDLQGYQTVSLWGKRADFLSTPYELDDHPRYTVGVSRERSDTGAENQIDAEAAKNRIRDHLARPHTSVRLVGPSGVGKSRYIQRLLDADGTALALQLNATAIFAAYETVASNILAVANNLASSTRSAILVVDECPRRIAIALAEAAAMLPSLLRVITIGNDDQPLDGELVLHVHVSPSEGEMIERIIRRGRPEIKQDALDRLSALCGGFARFAVMASKGDLTSDFETIAGVVDKILDGSSVSTPQEVRALECLSMFDAVGVEGNVYHQLDEVADRLARMSGDEMFEHLAKAARHDLVGRRESIMSAQPRPIAIFLARRRIELIRPNTLDRFLAEADTDLVLSMLGRWRYLAGTSEVRRASERMLHPGGFLESEETILTAPGAAILDALVHIVPDAVADRIRHTLLPLDAARLMTAKDARRSLLAALSKLAFRRESFRTAARMLLKLAVAENENWANNATGLFRQLFQVQLSGTEAPPDERLAILDEGLNSEHSAEVAVCVEAAASIFLTHVTRFGDSGEIGTQHLKDWSPSVWGDVFDFFREGLTRLVDLRHTKPEFAQRCEAIISGAGRQLLGSGIYQAYGETLVSISTDKGYWPEAIAAVGMWLYYDRKGSDPTQTAYIRQLYDRLFPADVVERAIVFTKSWTVDIRDPDMEYSDGDNDFGYSEREAKRLAAQIAADADLTKRTISTMTAMDLKTVIPFAVELATKAADPEALFSLALEQLSSDTTHTQLLRGILRGIDNRDTALASACLAQAVEQLGDSVSLLDLYSSVSMDDARLSQIVKALSDKKVPPEQCAFLSYGRGLDSLSVSAILPLLEELARHEADGLWSAFEIAMMYHYGEGVFDPALADWVLTSMGHVDLINDRQQPRNAHVFESLLAKASKVTGLDATKAESLAAQLVRLAQTKSYDTFAKLDGAFRQLARLLAKNHPSIIWNTISYFYGLATPIELDRLATLIGPNPDNFDRASHTGPGLIFHVSDEQMVEWTDMDPDRRIALLVENYPTLQRDSEGRAEWTVAFEDLATRYGGRKAFSEALHDRIYPRSWSGSIVPLISVYLGPLERWLEHPNRTLAAWAKEEHFQLTRRIESESGPSE